MADRPSSSPTAQAAPPTKTRTTVDTSNTASTRLVATPPPKRLAQRIETRSASHATTAEPTPRAQLAKSKVAETQHQLTAGGASRSGSRGDNHSGDVVGRAPRQSSTEYAGELEAYLQGLLGVTEQLLDPDTVQLLSSTLRAVQQARRLRKGARPVGTSASRRLGEVGTPKCDRAGVSDCLVRACRTSSHAQCVRILCEHYDACISPVETTQRPGCACLVAAAMAEWVLSRGQSPPTGSPPTSTLAAAPDGRCSSTPPSSTSSLDWQTKALEGLEFAVACGHVGAMLRVGLCLRDGVAGLAADLPAGLTWIERAASTGYAPAMHEMGVLYENGLCVGGDILDEDWGAAVTWYRRAAEKAHHPSQLNLGKLLLVAAECESAAGNQREEHVRHALKAQALEWLESAAASEDQEAIRLLRRLS